MSSQELDYLIEQINNNYKNSWEQSRLIASAMGAKGITFSWDSENNEKAITQDELKQNFEAFNNYTEKLF